MVPPMGAYGHGCNNTGSNFTKNLRKLRKHSFESSRRPAFIKFMNIFKKVTDHAVSDDSMTKLYLPAQQRVLSAHPNMPSMPASSGPNNWQNMTVSGCRSQSQGSMRCWA